MGTIWQDIRYGLRMLLKSPSVSVVATIALALGIGANTAIFSVVNAVLLRPLPFPNSAALMSVFEKDQTRGVANGSYSYPNFFDLREQNHVFDHIAAYHDNDFIMTGRGEPIHLQGGVVTADLFSVLEATPLLGRAFLPNEDKPTETGRVVVLSERLFASRFKVGVDAIARDSAVRCHHQRPDDISFDRSVAVIGSPACLLYPCVARDESRSAGGAAIRVRKRSSLWCEFQFHETEATTN